MDNNEAVYREPRGVALARMYYSTKSGYAAVVECQGEVRKSFIRDVGQYTAATVSLRFAGVASTVTGTMCRLPRVYPSVMSLFGDFSDLANAVSQVRVTDIGNSVIEGMTDEDAANNGMRIERDVEFCGGNFTVLHVGDLWQDKVRFWDFLLSRLSGLHQSGCPDFMVCGMESSNRLLAQFDKYEMRTEANMRGLPRMSFVNWESSKLLSIAA